MINDIEKVSEIILADHFAPQAQAEKVTTIIESISVRTLQEAPISLPAALCDDKLLNEINSIPEKMGFKIGEVAEMLGIKQYVLRYWESEFDVLNPKKAANNQRYYTRKDVENAYLIRKLLHRDRFSIEGARSAMRELKTFVRGEVKKEKNWTSFNTKIDLIQDSMDDLTIDIHRMKMLFR